jgi:CRISPR system Cascade subunit CasE
MYISCLLIDVGTNPDRPRPGRLWLRNLYHVHQRLCMAFPSEPRRKRDPDFLLPYDPGEFPQQRHWADRKKGEIGADLLKHVHSPRQPEAGFLFRIDPQPGGRVVILVQSALKPDWHYAFHNAGYLLAAPPQVKPFDPSFTVGERLRFRLVANPTRRLSKRSPGADGQPVKNWANKGGKGMRVPVPADRLSDWLARQAEKAGFSVEKKSASVSPSYVYVNKAREEKGVRLRSVRYDGTLTVTDPARFREGMRQGIGPAKAFGFGLLSVAACRTSSTAEAP